MTLEENVAEIFQSPAPVIISQPMPLEQQLLNAAARTCGACQHRKPEGTCRHPQARSMWGRHTGMERWFTDDAVKYPPVAANDRACGWWRP